jgi:hypothetical protein
MMLSREYLVTAQTLLRVARSMADRTIAARLKMLAEEYERRAGQASRNRRAGASRVVRDRV